MLSRSVGIGYWYLGADVVFLNRSGTGGGNVRYGAQAAPADTIDTTIHTTDQTTVGTTVDARVDATLGSWVGTGLGTGLGTTVDATVQTNLEHDLETNGYRRSASPR